MDEGKELEETSISPGDILRNRYWIVNIIWSSIWILIVWWIIFSGFLVFFFNPLGLILFFCGLGSSWALQIRYTLGWPKRLPFFVPKPFGQTKATRNALIAMIIWIPIFGVIAWLWPFHSWLNPLFVSMTLALFSFIMGASISGFWLSLIGLIRWENREGIRIVNQGNKFIALDQDEVYPPKPGNT
ncbi:MAG: hypothetical protein Q6364_01825 [Candidatus Hermodarchaeota archaeon]|nr:hypothetical protein [Candidatus Hermodarchaeota archaeon]